MSAVLFGADTPPARAEQFRMRRLQVYDWGTFSGLHEIPVAEKGFLFVGRSGSGKSTLLDAIAALLTPPQWLDFNAAAREAERSGRDRSMVSYIRGAWADRQDDESGEVATQYLRRGSTWSALALEFSNSAGRVVTMVRLLWIAGNSVAATDVRKHYLVAERAFDLMRDLDGFDLDMRKLKKRLMDVHHHEKFSAYAERFRHLLGIENESALRLLHKTQSAKNLGDLNRFLREFMLERPETFDVARRLVEEFSELDAAHRAVVAARRQIETLRPARDEHTRLVAARGEKSVEETLELGLDGFRERKLASLLQARLAAIITEDDALAARKRALSDFMQRHDAEIADLDERYRASGGAEIERLERERIHWSLERDDRARRHERARRACESLGVTLAGAPEHFVAQRDEARRRLEGSLATRRAFETQLDELRLELRRANEAFLESAAELDALRRHPSNLPETAQALRHRMCAVLNLDEGALPFVGELIEVRGDEAAWRGAIERLLHGFAQSLLVEERYYVQVAQWVNETHLAGKLVYYRTHRRDLVPAARPRADSVLRKLSLADHPQRDWLQAELSRRFDYEAVDSPRRLREAERAVTREGQIKHGPQRHEKDDRRPIDDRRHWYLGFDNREKQRLFESDVAELERRRGELQQQCDALVDRRDKCGDADAAARELSQLDWHEIDVAPALQEVDRIDAMLALARASSVDLAKVDRRIQQAKARKEKLQRELNQQESRRMELGREADKRQRDLDACRQRLEVAPLEDAQQRGLNERLSALPETTLDNLGDHFRVIAKALTERIRALDAECATLGHAIVDRFADFIRTWPAEAADFHADVSFAGDFFARLERLEDDNLPAFETRFFELLRTQSGQNLAALQTHIQQAHKQIRVRMADVNEALARVPYNRDTHLQIKVEDRRLPDVIGFRQQLAGVLGHRQTEDRDLAERQFQALRAVIERLAAKDTETSRWREQVLDVRLHVEFIGEELEADTGCQVEVYRSGAGKSGGQRQKLATTCLAAALRYQLGSEDNGLPRYAAVVLDEAFDKTDNEFTAMAMGIFENFGFQMIVATPLKSVMTLEPFIGGACFVDIHGRHDSRVLVIEYDDARQRLRLPENASGALADA
jgi:uncharacterized protein YPO0396